MARRSSLVVVLATPLLVACGVSTMHSQDGLEGTTTTDGGRTGASAAPVTPTTSTATPDAGSPVTIECEAPESRACTTSCGSTGTQRCVDVTWGACEVPGERCDNGGDDDCDGQVDHHDRDCTPITHTCEESEGGGCNGDLGYGDHCAAEDNTGGCSPARFHAWCNRRNPEFPDVWEAWIVSWVDSRCDGAVTNDGAHYTTYSCLDSSNDLYECTTPLVLQFEAGAVRFAASSARFAFTPAAPVVTDWPTAETPWLVRDLDGDGRITSGRELFGSDTLLREGRTALHGFEALAQLDDGDGTLDGRDPAFASLRTWRDLDGDKQTDPGELRTLDEEGVTALAVRFTTSARCDARGNCERERSAFTFVHDGEVRRGAVVDVYLRVETELLTCR